MPGGKADGQFRWSYTNSLFLVKHKPIWKSTESVLLIHNLHKHNVGHFWEVGCCCLDVVWEKDLFNAVKREFSKTESFTRVLSIKNQLLKCVRNI